MAISMIYANILQKSKIFKLLKIKELEFLLK